MEYSSTPFSCHSEERSDVGISGDGNHNRVWVPHPIVIPSMSSAETCLQGFPNDDIFGVIAFALVQIKAVGLRYKRTITVEQCRAWQSSVAKYKILHNLRLRRNIIFCDSKKYHLRKAQISLLQSNNITKKISGANPIFFYN